MVYKVTLSSCLEENHVHILGFDGVTSSCYHFTSLGKYITYARYHIRVARNQVSIL